MSTSQRVSPDVARLSSAFSTPVFRDLSRASADLDGPRVAPIVALGKRAGATTLGDAFDLAHQTLRREYRTEYVYKNELISKIVFGRHSPRTASALLELTMGASCADLVIMNGTSTTYEVKTDHDDFARLCRQLEDYSTRTEFVHVVVSERRAQVAVQQVQPSVGVLAIRPSGAIATIRAAESNMSILDVDHMFHMLRTAEALRILNRLIGYELDVQPGYASPRMRELFSNLPVLDVHAGVVEELKQRGRTAGNLAASPGFPASLRALAYSTELSGVAAERILQRLT